MNPQVRGVSGFPLGELVVYSAENNQQVTVSERFRKALTKEPHPFRKKKKRRKVNWRVAIAVRGSDYSANMVQYASLVMGPPCTIALTSGKPEHMTLRIYFR